MISLSEAIKRTKRRLRLPSGVKISVATNYGDPVHGATKIAPVGLKELLADEDLIEMRVGPFCESFARCIGAQIGARVTLEFAGQAIDGRRKLKTLI